MLSNSFSWSFLKDLWALSLVFPWVSLFYFLQTLERLPPKYASINGRLYFSQIVFRSCSSTYKNSLTYFCRGFLFRDITSKMLKNVSLFSPFHFCLTHWFPSVCSLPTAAFPAWQPSSSCSVYIHSLWNFFPIQGNTFFSLIFYLLSSLLLTITSSQSLSLFIGEALQTRLSCSWCNQIWHWAQVQLGSCAIFPEGIPWTGPGVLSGSF